MRPDVLIVEDLRVRYDSAYGLNESVLGGVSFNCREGEIVTVIGRSGVGKTTLLRAIGGLIPLEGGSVRVDGRVVERPSRERCLVFQDYPSFPWLSVRKNVEIGGRFDSSLRKQEIQQLAFSLLASVGLADYAEEYPSELSGGMRQRLAIARALAARPKVLLLDEPFGALDIVTRLNVQDLVTNIHSQIGQAIVMVTHDIQEAVLLSDRVLVLRGRPATLAMDLSIPGPREAKRLSAATPEQVEAMQALERCIMGESKLEILGDVGREGEEWSGGIKK